MPKAKGAPKTVAASVSALTAPPAPPPPAVKGAFSAAAATVKLKNPRPRTTKELKALLNERHNLETTVHGLKKDVQSRDRRLRLEESTAAVQENLFDEELRMADAEREALEAHYAHESRMAHARLSVAQGEASFNDGAVPMLREAQAERYLAMQQLNEEQLGRRHDVAKMHEELVTLRNRLEHEMRAGLEAFRETYREEVYTQLSEEAREAMHEKFKFEQYASKEHAWAEQWQLRYEELRRRFDDGQRALTNSVEEQDAQAHRIVMLKRRIAQLEGGRGEVEELREALASSASQQAALRAEVEAAREETRLAHRARARAVHEARRQQIESTLHHTLDDDDRVVSPPRVRSEAIERLAAPPSLAGAALPEGVLAYDDIGGIPAAAEEPTVLEAIWRRTCGEAPTGGVATCASASFVVASTTAAPSAQSRAHATAPVSDAPPPPPRPPLPPTAPCADAADEEDPTTCFITRPSPQMSSPARDARSNPPGAQPAAMTTSASASAASLFVSGSRPRTAGASPTPAHRAVPTRARSAGLARSASSVSLSALGDSRWTNTRSQAQFSTWTRPQSAVQRNAATVPMLVVNAGAAEASAQNTAAIQRPASAFTGSHKVRGGGWRDAPRQPLPLGGAPSLNRAEKALAVGTASAGAIRREGSAIWLQARPPAAPSASKAPLQKADRFHQLGLGASGEGYPGPLSLALQSRLSLGRVGLRRDY